MKKVSVILVFVLFSLLTLNGCTLTTMFSTGPRLNGSGKVVTETREVSGFNAVELAAIGKLIITPGTREALTITGDDNIVAVINTEVREGKLVFEFTSPGLNVNPLTNIVYNLTVVNISSLQISGAGDIEATGLKLESLTADVSGAGSIQVAGEASTQNVTIAGAGDYKAADLKSNSAEVTITGAGNATVWVVRTLDASISGLGMINYYGSPEVTKNITGAGTVNAKGDK